MSNYRKDELEAKTRDEIRVLAKEAGVSNVSYNTKAENIRLILNAQIKESVAFRQRNQEALDEVFPMEDDDFDEVDEDEDEVKADFDEDDEVDDDEDREPEPFSAYNISIHQDGRSTITFVDDDGLQSITQEHPAFERILADLLVGRKPRSYDPASSLAASIEHIGDSRLSVATPTDGAYLGADPANYKPSVLFDGEPIHGRMVDVFLRYHLEGRDATNLVRFLERCKANPVEGAAEGLFNWGGSERLTITPEGHFIGFKAVRNTLDADVYESSSSGEAWVNGEHRTGRIRQQVGDVVTMPPRLVTPGPECSTGLHVGDWNYASTFLGSTSIVMEVDVDPADVVNVPNYETGKMRVVKYLVSQIHDRASEDDASHQEPEAVAVEDVEYLLAEAEVPATFWKRLLGRKRG